MYTRNYFDGSEGGMPRGYDGVALRPEPTAVPEETEVALYPKDMPQKAEKVGYGGILQGLLGSLHIGLPSLDKIGYEEILIIAVAAFLFFSGDGDKECALIMLALLLIN